MATERATWTGSSVSYWLLQEKYPKSIWFWETAEKLLIYHPFIHRWSGWTEGSSCSKALTKAAEVKREISFQRDWPGLTIVLHLLYRATLPKKTFHPSQFQWHSLQQGHWKSVLSESQDQLSEIKHPNTLIRRMNCSERHSTRRTRHCHNCLNRPTDFNTSL